MKIHLLFFVSIQNYYATINIHKGYYKYVAIR